MTYLDTLVRTLPRQRRAFEEQRKIGYLIALVGFLIALGGTVLIIVLVSLAGLPLYALCAVLGGLFMLLGGYRATRAEILIAENKALAAAVIECRQELREEAKQKLRDQTGSSTGPHLHGDIQARFKPPADLTDEVRATAERVSHRG